MTMNLTMTKSRARGRNARRACDMFLYIKSPYINYKLEFNRKVTIIRGESGTGKSTIVDMFRRSITDATINIYNDLRIPIKEIRGDEDHSFFKTGKRTIYLVDEDTPCIYSDRFARIVNETDNFFIIITRNPIPSLSYSYKEVYQLRNSGKFTDTIRAYSDKDRCNFRDMEVVLVEDSKSGCKFFSHHLDNRVVSANGRSNIVKELSLLIISGYRKIGVVIDGAAAGSEMNSIEGLINFFTEVEISLFIPECFEEFLISNKILNFKYIDNNSDEDKLKKNKFGSYEKFYESIIKQETLGTPAAYMKSNLSSCFTKDCCHKKDSRCVLHTNISKVQKVKDIMTTDLDKLKW